MNWIYRSIPVAVQFVTACLCSVHPFWQPQSVGRWKETTYHMMIMWLESKFTHLKVCALLSWNNYSRNAMITNRSLYCNAKMATTKHWKLGYFEWCIINSDKTIITYANIYTTYKHMHDICYLCLGMFKKHLKLILPPASSNYYWCCFFCCWVHLMLIRGMSNNHKGCIHPYTSRHTYTLYM